MTTTELIRDCIQCEEPLLEWQKEAFKKEGFAWISICQKCGMSHCLVEQDDDAPAMDDEELSDECQEIVDRVKMGKMN